MKKSLIFVFAIGMFAVGHSAFAISGACSGHGGVNYGAGADSDGSVICYDGWRNSSVLSNDMGSNVRTGYPTSTYATPKTTTYQPQYSASASAAQTYTTPIYTTPTYTAPTYTYSRNVYGTVFAPESSCDYYIVSTTKGYSLLEWYGGNVPETGDILYGNINSYGFETMYNTTDERETRAWVDDWLLSAESVVKKYIDKCD